MILRSRGLKSQATERIGLGNCRIPSCARGDLDLLLLILDPADKRTVAVEGNRTMIATDKLDLNGCAFDVRIDVKYKVITRLLSGIAAKSGITRDVLQCSGNVASANSDT